MNEVIHIFHPVIKIIRSEPKYQGNKQITKCQHLYSDYRAQTHSAPPMSHPKLTHMIFFPKH